MSVMSLKQFMITSHLYITILYLALRALIVYKCTHGCMPFAAWLKIVYHDTTSEEESTTVEPYYTIESFLIPDLYLAINLEQPSQEGSDTYYPVQFLSKTEVNVEFRCACMHVHIYIR